MGLTGKSLIFSFPIALSLSLWVSPMSFAVEPPSFVNDCGTTAYKPDQLTPYCADAGAAVIKIRWATWTRSKAIGQGLYTVNNCVPDCIDGKWKTHRVAIVLSKAMKTHGHLFLLNVNVHSIDDAPLPTSGTNVHSGNSFSWVANSWNN